MSQIVVVQLVGGPGDGVRLFVRYGMGLVVLPDPETPAGTPMVDSDHVVAHFYMISPDWKTAVYMGRKSRHEIKVEHSGYRQHDADDDWWRSGPKDDL